MNLMLRQPQKNHHPVANTPELDYWRAVARLRHREIDMKGSKLFLASLALASLLPGLSQAADDQASGCMEVSVGGYKAPDYNCLSQRMGASRNVAAERKNQTAMNVPVNQRAPNAVGVFNQSATRNRMGDTFGTSAKAQRPAATPAVNPLLNGR